jgi:hypothetical protein
MTAPVKAGLDWGRWWRHLSGRWASRRLFPAAVLDAIERAVRDCESRHPGEIRFVIEGALPLADLFEGIHPRERAVELFSDLRVWDTEHNNGVLIYVLLADRDVEIVADRGVAGGRVPVTEWEACCRVIESHYKAGRFEAGSIAGIEAVAAVLARFPPDRPDVGNEMPNAPVLL